MKIEKTAKQANNFRINEYYYNSAREGMFDLLQNMLAAGIIETILLPSYIGWSPKEGSGIFDPINNLEGITIQYYKMTYNLNINYDDLINRIEKLGYSKFAVLVINYFGFIDPRIGDISVAIKKKSGWLIEDNAHGFFTYQYTEEIYSDATFFSLHKMFPLKYGGSLTINNKQLASLKYIGDDISITNYNPWQYDVHSIAKVRRKNYNTLENIIIKKGISEYLLPLELKKMDISTVPQSFPICIKKGNRNDIYELMNASGFGVVSLYHTLIKPLQITEFQASVDLSRCIMNLPVHQDVDITRYVEMIQLLTNLCKTTNLE